MRLICGIQRWDGRPVEAKLLSAMAGAMVHDGLNPQVRMVCRGATGLAVLDFSRSGDGTIAAYADGVIAADARLDTPAALAAALGLSSEDEEVLLSAAVARWGAAAPWHVLGDYAYAYWNERNGRLQLARDPFGIRPLCYSHQRDKFFAFASFPVALYGAGLVPRRLNEAEFVSEATLNWSHEGTLIEGVHRVPAAHVLEAEPQGPKLHRYWSPASTKRKRSDISYPAAAAELRRRLEEAVHSRLPRLGPVAAHLSGGLDSSSIAILAARRLARNGQKLHAFSFLDDQRGDVTVEDETAYVRTILDEEPEIVWTPLRPRHLGRLAAPIVDSDGIVSIDPEDPELVAARSAAAAGADLILSGWGGDEAVTFNGRGVLAEHFVRGRWKTLWREIASVRRERNFSIRQILLGNLAEPLVPLWLWSLARRLRGKRAFSGLDFESILTSRGRRGIRPRTALDASADARETSRRLIGSGHIVQRCENWAATGARYGTAFAFPMLDRRLVECVLSLPSSYFLRNGFRRAVFREAMKGVLPDKVRLRHVKFATLPSLPLALAEQKADLLKAADRIEENKAITALIDVDRLRERIVGLPDPAALQARMTGNFTVGCDDVLILHTLRVAACLKQNVRRDGDTGIEG